MRPCTCATRASVSPPTTSRAIFQEFAQVEAPSSERCGARGWGCLCRASWPAYWEGTCMWKANWAWDRLFLADSRIFEGGTTAAYPRSGRERSFRNSVLIVEDNFETRLIYGQYLKKSKLATNLRPQLRAKRKTCCGDCSPRSFFWIFCWRGKTPGICWRGSKRTRRPNRFRFSSRLKWTIGRRPRPLAPTPSPPSRWIAIR